MLESIYVLLGVPIRVRAESPELLSLADEALGEFLAASVAPRFLSLTLALSHEEEEPPCRKAPRFRSDLYALSVAMGKSCGCASRIQGVAEARITPAALACSGVTAAGMIEPLALFLAAGVRRATLHAAALSLGDQGLVLTGAAGAGKSTLAYACARAGFCLVSEDIAFAGEPYAGREVWGDSRFIHLLPDAPALFPELAGMPLTPRGSEERIRVVVQNRKPCMQATAILLVTRGSGPASRITPTTSAALRGALTQFEGSPPLDREAMNRAADALGTVRSAQIEVGTNLAEAAEGIRHWVEGKQAGAQDTRKPCTSSVSTTTTTGR